MRVLVDAGALIALLNRNDTHHGRISEFFADYFGRAYTTWPVLTEAAHLVSEHLSVSVLRLVERGRLEIVEITPGIARMADLMQRYADLPMDLADASLVWAAEHTSVVRVVTLDRADFEIYRIKGNRPFEVLP
ncbi:MAG TPA: PIN domain-containing protein [Candidatus Krumholzibacteria bacterium]